MADHHDTPDDEAGNETARGTFFWTMVLAACFVGTVIVYVLLR